MLQGRLWIGMEPFEQGVHVFVDSVHVPAAQGAAEKEAALGGRGRASGAGGGPWPRRGSRLQ